MDKRLKMLALGIAAFFITLAIVLLVLSSGPEQADVQPIAPSEKINVVEKELTIEGSSFGTALIEVPKGSILRLKVLNRDFNMTHQIVLLQPYSTGLYSVIERRSIRYARAEPITIFNYEHGLSYNESSFDGSDAIADELLISCTTCKGQTLARIISKK